MQKLLKFVATAALAAQITPCFADAPVQATPLEASITSLRTDWAHIKYQVPDKATKEAEITGLETRADKAVTDFPASAEAKIWAAIILATDAGISKSMSGLPKVKRAKALLEQALQQNDKALDGSAYTTLGSLYYQVPGWPISFGDKDKAGENLKAALAINPDGIDPNYFYGDYLMKIEKYSQAVTALRHALAAPARPGFETIDAGRKEEINQDLAVATTKLNTKAAGGYN